MLCEFKRCCNLLVLPAAGLVTQVGVDTAPTAKVKLRHGFRFLGFGRRWRLNRSTLNPKPKSSISKGDLTAPFSTRVDLSRNPGKVVR